MTFRTEFLKQMKGSPERGVLYVMKEFEIVVYLCPCGCGLEICTAFGNLWPGNRWKLTLDGDKVTLDPSIAVRGGCKSHFWIKENRIVWA